MEVYGGRRDRVAQLIHLAGPNLASVASKIKPVVRGPPYDIVNFATF